jgi:hypothetical protein
MPVQCGCDTAVRTSVHSLGCLECGAPCCPSCAISLESATYCRTCAAQLLGTVTVRAGSTFDLH